MNFFLKKIYLCFYKILYVLKKIIKYFLIKINKQKINKKLLLKIEKRFIKCNFSISLTKEILYNIQKNIDCNKIYNYISLQKNIEKQLKLILFKSKKLFFIKKKNPFVFLIIGINGSGKTTAVAKLAYFYKKLGKKVLLSAGDTFRKAAIEQLKYFGKLLSVKVVAQNIGSDSSSIVYDSIISAKSKKFDIVIIDTAGRLPNKKYLMNELNKVITVMKKVNISIPHEILLVIDANSGQNIIQQVNLFIKKIFITGIILTKVNKNNKGGIIFPISKKFNIPIKFISSTECVKDLRIFHIKEFVRKYFI